MRVYNNPLQENGCFVLCEVFTRDGAVHETNYRALIDDAESEGFWFGFEQEYVLMTSSGRSVGFRVDGKDYIEALCAGFEPFHKEHLADYGAGNERRLTGAHETASIDQFSFGASNRAASIRIPIYTTSHDWKGYLEDRRPASDPRSLPDSESNYANSKNSASAGNRKNFLMRPISR